MEMVARTAMVLQGLMTTVATEVGRACRLIKRKREFTESSLVATFVLGFLRHPQATWDQLALVASDLGANVTPQAVEQRVTPVLRDTLKEVWLQAIGCVVKADERVQPLLQRFSHVLIGDSTTIPLCDALADEFPGCGGSHGSGKAAAKWQVIWDCVTGAFWKMSWEAGKHSDAKSEILNETPPPGSLSIFDLGYFSLDRFRQWQEAGAHWISRGISDITVTAEGVTHDLHNWLNAQVGGPVDQWVEVGALALSHRRAACASRGGRAATSKGTRQSGQEGPTTDRTPSRHLRLDGVPHVVPRRLADLERGRRAVPPALADRAAVQVVEVSQLVGGTSYRRSRATTGRTVFADDRGGDSTLADPHHVLVRPPAEPDQSRTLDPPRTLAIDPPRATTPRTHRAAHPLANPLPRPSPTRQTKNQTLQPPTHRNP